MSEKLTHEELEAKVRDLEHEIVKHKLAEDKFLESEALLPRSQQIAHVGSWKLDLIANRLIWSDEAYRIFGLKPKEFAATYEALLDAVHPDDRKAVNDAYFDSLHECKGSYKIEHRIVRKDTGEIRHLHESYFHERNTEGTTICSIGMVQDITERVIAQEKLEKSENRQTSLVNAISKAGIWLFIVDKDYCVRYMNELMIQSFGNAIGKICYRDVKGDDFPCLYCQLAEVIENGKMVNYESKLADGRIFAVTAVPYH